MALQTSICLTSGHTMPVVAVVGLQRSKIPKAADLRDSCGKSRKVRTQLLLYAANVRGIFAELRSRVLVAHSVLCAACHRAAAPTYLLPRVAGLWQPGPPMIHLAVV